MRDATWIGAVFVALLAACGGSGAAPELAETLVGGDVAARVTWDDGTPAAGVHVQLWAGPDRLTPLSWGVTDADGTFVWHDVPPGGVRVVSDRRVRGRVERDDDAPVVVDVAVLDGADVRGSVVDAAGRPVRDAEVVALSRMHDRTFPVATTDADGRFELRAVRDTFLEARAPGRGPSDPTSTLHAHGHDGLTLALTDTPRVVSGRVVDEAGEPLPGADVELRRRSSLGGARTLPGPVETTDAQGRFAFGSVAADRLQLAVGAAGHAPHEVAIDARDADVTGVSVALSPGWTVRGVVTDEAGRPVEDARVRWWSVRHRADDLTDAQGGYLLEDLPVDWHRSDEPIRVSHGAWVDTTSADDASFTPGPAAVWDPVLRRGGTIAGVVVDAAGEPVAGASVHARDEGRATASIRATDAAGRFELEGLPAGVYDVVASARGYSSSALRAGLRPGVDHLRLDLGMPGERGGVVGHVADDRNWARAALVRAHGVVDYQSTSIHAGTFAFDGVPAGVGRLRLSCARTGLPLTLDVVVHPDEPTDLGLLDLTDTLGRVVVRLAADDEELLESARVRLDVIDLRGDVRSVAAWPDPDTAGVFVVEDLVPASYDVVVHGRGVARTTRPVDVVAGRVADVEHVLERGVPVRPHVTWRGARGDDPELQLFVVDDEGRDGVHHVDRVLRTVLEDLELHLAPGSYTLEAVDERHRTGSARFDVVLGEPTTVSVEVR